MHPSNTIIVFQHSSQNRNEKSAVAEHTWSNQTCNMDWDGTRILTHASTTLQLRMKEALHIQLNQQHLLINRDKGMELSKCWASLMKTTTTYHYCLFTISVNFENHQYLCCLVNFRDDLGIVRNR